MADNNFIIILAIDLFRFILNINSVVIIHEYKCLYLSHVYFFIVFIKSGLIRIPNNIPNICIYRNRVKYEVIGINVVIVIVN